MFRMQFSHDRVFFDTSNVQFNGAKTCQNLIPLATAYGPGTDLLAANGQQFPSGQLFPSERSSAIACIQ